MKCTRDIVTNNEYTEENGNTKIQNVHVFESIQTSKRLCSLNESQPFIFIYFLPFIPQYKQNTERNILSFLFRFTSRLHFNTLYTL